MPVITCSFLSNQRAGNAMFIYAFCRAYAEAMGCDLITPPWIGEKIFQNIPKPNLLQRSIRLPKTIPDHLHPEMMGHFFGQKDIDIQAYAQHKMYLDWYSRAKVKEWFKLKPEYDKAILNNFFPYATAHLRRGDYTQPPFNKLYATVSDASYHLAMGKFGIPRDAHYIQQEKTFPLSIHVDIGAPWLTDFITLRDATHLLRANSSFSWWAATLGNGKVYSPVVGNKVGWQDVDFVEGNWPTTAGGFKNQSDLHLKES